MLRFLFAPATALALAACATAGDMTIASQFDSARMDAALAEQAPEVQARYQWRHPKETLEFFGVAPGMTVVDVLPGNDGYYSKILISYLGANGRVIGADYSPEMWKLFGSYVNEEFIAKKATWATDWTATAEDWRKSDDSASVGAFAYGSLPEDMQGTADVVILVRAMHHFNRFEEEGGFLTAALKDTYDVLKPGGIVGVVQHRAPEANSDEWAEGDNGYLKQSQQIAAFKAAGFEFIASSEINANPADKPTESDRVWRLPPSLGTSRDNPELKAQMEAIGESDRMTLKFRKPH
jgi:predicted methyltransferase